MTVRLDALRRRRKRPLVTWLRIFGVFIAVIAGVAGYGGYVLITLPAFRVHAVDVHIEGLAVTEREVLHAASIDRNSNVWLLNTAAIARRIEAIPYVDTATVRRAPPAHVAIAVTERQAAACVHLGARTVTIDQSRRILQEDCVRPSVVQIVLHSGTLGAPGTVATPAALAALLTDGRALSDANVGVRSIGEDGFGQLEAVDTNGIRLLFGSDTDLAQKAKLVAPVLAATRPGRTIRAIDLRAPATPTVEFQ